MGGGGEKGRRNFGRPTWGRIQQPETAVLPFPTSLCSVLICASSGVAASIWDFNVHTDVHACD